MNFVRFLAHEFQMVERSSYLSAENIVFASLNPQVKHLTIKFLVSTALIFSSDVLSNFHFLCHLLPRPTAPTPSN